MVRCDYCMKNPFHPDKKCCFNCARVSTDCEVWHNCGEDCPGWKNKIVTNADKIRAMTDEELADWLARTQIANVAEALSVAGFPWEVDSEIHDGTKMHCLEWLKQPAEDD